MSMAHMGRSFGFYALERPALQQDVPEPDLFALVCSTREFTHSVFMHSITSNPLYRSVLLLWQAVVSLPFK